MARDRLSEYLEAVGGQIRWKRARRPLLRELSDHIADQAAAFEAEGQSPEEALSAAVAEMGEPEAVGRELDRLHRPRSCWSLVLAIVLLFLAGLLLQNLVWLSVGNTEADYCLRRQLAGFVLSGGLLVCLWFADYTLLFRRRWVPVVVMAALCLCFIPAAWLRAWRYFPPYHTLLYPALLLPVPYAALVVRLRGRGPLTVLLCGLAALLLPFTALLAPSLTTWLVSGGSMLLVLLCAVGLGWFRGKRRWNLVAALGPALTLALGMGFRLTGSEYAQMRLAVFWNPELDPMGAGWLYSCLRSGQFPSTFNGSDPDMLLAQLSQELGRWVLWAAGAGILLLAVLLLRRVGRLRSRTGKLVGLAALCPLLLQAAVYWLYNLGWWPSGALSLPFLSYGVAFLLVDAALAGVLLSVLRMDALVRDTAAAFWAPFSPPDAVNIPLGRGTLHIEYRKKA